MDTGIYGARLHGFLDGRWLRFRDLMCDCGVHWPLSWELNGEMQELLCRRRDCHRVVRKRRASDLPERSETKR
jgi:hypothetical protein